MATSFESIGKFVSRKFGAGQAKRLQAAVVIAVADEILRRELGDLVKQLRIVSLKDGVLKVETGSSVAAQEIAMKAADLARRINEKCRAEAVRKIQVRA